MTEIEIYHDFTHCNHYIPNKIINLKNTGNIIHILRKNYPNFAKKGHFLMLPKNAKTFFSTPKTRLSIKN